MKDGKTTPSTVRLVVALLGFWPEYDVGRCYWTCIYIYGHSSLAAARSLPMAAGGCVLLGATMGAFDYSGQLTGEPGVTREERRLKFFKKPPPPLIDPVSQ